MFTSCQTPSAGRSADTNNACKTLKPHQNRLDGQMPTRLFIVNCPFTVFYWWFWVSHLVLQLRNHFSKTGLRCFRKLRVETLTEAFFPVLLVLGLQNMQREESGCFLCSTVGRSSFLGHRSDIVQFLNHTTNSLWKLFDPVSDANWASDERPSAGNRVVIIYKWSKRILNPLNLSPQILEKWNVLIFPL